MTSLTLRQASGKAPPAPMPGMAADADLAGSRATRPLPHPKSPPQFPKITIHRHQRKETFKFLPPRDILREFLRLTPLPGQPRLPPEAYWVRKCPNFS
jgi:hypothetical protein